MGTATLDRLNTAADMREIIRDIATQTFYTLNPRPRSAIVISTDPANKRVECQYPDEVGVTFWVKSTVIMPQTGSTVRVSGPDGARYIDEVQIGNVRIAGNVDITGSLSAGSVAPSGLGTMSIQDADNVAIIGGAISGVTLSLPDGSLAAPAVKFSLDTNTGIRRSATDTVGIVAGGVDGLTVSPTLSTFATDVALASGKSLSLGSSTAVQQLNLYGTAYGMGIQSGTLYARTGGTFSLHLNGVHSATANDPGAGGTELMRVGTSVFTYKGFEIFTANSYTTLDARYVNHTDGYVSSIAGTANQVSVSAATGAVTLSLPSAVTMPGSLAVTTTLGVTGATTLATLGTSGLATLNSASVSTTLGVVGQASFTLSPTISTEPTLSTHPALMSRLGASNTGGTLDWDDATNARPGAGFTLLNTGATNHPAAGFFHPFSLEYASKNGTGNITQLAIPYANTAATGRIWMRGRYAGVWGAWQQLWSSGAAIPLGGTNTSGNYVATIAGTANQITVAGSGSATAAVTLSLPSAVTLPGSLVVTTTATVTGLLTASAALTVTTGDLTVTAGNGSFNAARVVAGLIAGVASAGLTIGTDASPITIYRPTANALAVTNISGGFRVGGSMRVGDTAVPAFVLDVVGTANISGAATFGSTLGVTGLATLTAGLTTPAQITSTIVTGTPPIVVASTTKVTNLHADLFDGQEGTYYLDFANQTNRTTPVINLGGDLSGSVSLTSLGNGPFTLTATIVANAVALGTDTTGNYIATIAGTTNQVNVSGSGSETAAVTLSLPQNIDTAATVTFFKVNATTAYLGYLDVDEFSAKVFISDTQLVVSGTQIVARSSTTLAAAFTAPALGASGTITVRDLPAGPNQPVFASGETVVMSTFVRTASGGLTKGDCVGVVTTYADLSGGSEGFQTWLFTRNTGANGGNMTAATVIPVDSAVVDYGTSGDGFIKTDAYNDTSLLVATWTTSPVAGNIVDRVRLGRLDTVTSNTDEFGFLSGVWASRTSTPVVRLSSVANEFYNVPIRFYNSGVETMKLDPTVPSLALGNPLPTGVATGTGIWMGLASALYQFRVGNPLGDQLLWNGVSLSITGSIVGGSIAIGTAPNQFVVSSAGDVTIGNVASGNYVSITNAGAINVGGTDASSWHVSPEGRMWSGNAAYASAPFFVSEFGDLGSTTLTLRHPTTLATVAQMAVGTSGYEFAELLLSNGPAWEAFGISGRLRWSRDPGASDVQHVELRGPTTTGIITPTVDLYSDPVTGGYKTGVAIGAGTYLAGTGSFQFSGESSDFTGATIAGFSVSDGGGINTHSLLLADSGRLLLANAGSAVPYMEAPYYVSTVATGTAPITVTSTTVVTNLNADKLDGNDWHANLTALVGLAGVADRVPYFTGVGAMSLATFNAAGRSLVSTAGTANTFPYFSSANTVTLASVTAAALSILDDASTTAIRTTLGVGTGDTPLFAGLQVGAGTVRTITDATGATFTALTNIVSAAGPLVGLGVMVSDGINRRIGMFVDNTIGAVGLSYLTGTGTVNFMIRNANSKIMEVSGTSSPVIAFTGTVSVSSTFTNPVTGASFGPGSTGTAQTVLILNGGSGAGGDTFFAIQRNSVTKAYVGLAGGTNGMVTGTVADDMIIRTTGSILVSTDNGVTKHLKFDTSGNMTIGPGGTGGASPAFVLDAGGTGGQPVIGFSRNSASWGIIGVAGAAGAIVPGTAIGDMAIRTSGARIAFSADGGTTQHFAVTNAGAKFWGSPYFGADSAPGGQNYNNETKPGTSTYLMASTETNGPSAYGAPSGGYFHVMNLEYGSKNGTGQITQLAIPYGNDMASGIWMRGRYSGSWTAWQGVEAKTSWFDLSSYYAGNVANWGAGWEEPRFRKIGDVVEMEGLLSIGTGGSITQGDTIATLPAGYRPAKVQGFFSCAFSGTNYPIPVYVNTTGAVIYYGPTTFSGPYWLGLILRFSLL